MREVLQTVSDTIAPWLLTYAVHSTLLLGAVWILGCFGLPKRDALREVCWKAAMVGAVITASLQTVGDLQPVGGSLELPAAPVAHDDVAPVSLDWETLALLAEGVPLLDTEPVVAAESEAAPIPWTDIGWTAVALAALVGAALVAVRRFRLTLRLVGRTDVDDDDLRGVVDGLARRAGVRRRVRLTVSSKIPVPIALGSMRPEICLPIRAREIDSRELECVLAHEMCHLARRDPAWLTLAHVLGGLFFFQPLNRVARRRLHELAEFACDRWAADTTGDGVALARCLTRIADWLVGTRPAALAASHATLAATRSTLGDRVGRLLEPRRRRRDVSRRRLVALGAVFIAVATIVAPGVSRAGEQTINAKYAMLDDELLALDRELRLLAKAARDANLSPDILRRLDAFDDRAADLLERRATLTEH